MCDYWQFKPQLSALLQQLEPSARYAYSDDCRRIIHHKVGQLSAPSNNVQTKRRTHLLTAIICERDSLPGPRRQRGICHDSAVTACANNQQSTHCADPLNRSAVAL